MPVRSYHRTAGLSKIERAKRAGNRRRGV